MHFPVLFSAVLFFTLPNALCQSTPPADDATQMHKQWDLGGRDRDLEKKDGSLNNAPVLTYVQQLADRLSAAASVPAVRVLLTRATGEYFSVSSRRVLYLSAGLFARTEDEAEFAGILAHGLAHLTLSDGACILDPLRPPDWSADRRALERQATELAVSYLKSAGFDPTSLLSLLSKLAYEHPVWAKAIRSEDLAQLRAVLENEDMPPQGYRLDSSDFAGIHAIVANTVNPEPAVRVRPALLRRTSR
jgi:predicted Zn-dependent protease